jgi:hypothetical protein
MGSEGAHVTILDQLDNVAPHWRRHWSDPLAAAVELGIIEPDEVAAEDEDDALLEPLRFDDARSAQLHDWQEYAASR